MLRKLLKLGVPTLKKLLCQQVPVHAQYEEIILGFLQPHHTVLDAGCGNLSRVPVVGKVATAVGIDADERISSNPGVDMLVRGDMRRLPFRDKSFDVVMSWMVVEHLDDPKACFTELRRIVRDDALVVITTPNLLHYANVLVSLMPYWLHEWFLRRIDRGHADSFPTVFKANTPNKLRQMMESARFTTVEVRCIDEGPEYCHWLTPLYAIGLIYHCLVSRFQKLSPLRPIMIGVFRPR